MKIEGQYVFENISRDSVWDFLTSPDRIAECLPGCEKLNRTNEDSYDMQMRLAIGAISGVFLGSVRLCHLEPPAEYQLSVTGKGAHGFINGDGTIRLTVSGNDTVLQYFGDVSAGGAIASLGQRMISGAARMVIDQFFRCVAQRLVHPYGT